MILKKEKNLDEQILEIRLDKIKVLTFGNFLFKAGIDAKVSVNRFVLHEHGRGSKSNDLDGAAASAQQQN